MPANFCRDGATARPAYAPEVPRACDALHEMYTRLVHNKNTTREKKKKVPVELQRFKLPCIGDQEDLPKILKNRQRKFNELKHDKRSVEYKKWFFKYSPNLLKKTQKEKTTKKEEEKGEGQEKGSKEQQVQKEETQQTKGQIDQKQKERSTEVRSTR